MIKTKSLLLCVLFFLVCSKINADDRIMIFGDSLSSAYGIDRHDGWVELLRKKLKEKKIKAKVINKSISGETTAGGVRRIEKALESINPTVVILELGANDGLRGLSIKTMMFNLRKMVEKIKQKGGKCLLVGIRIPPNYGPVYAENFSNAFSLIASETNSNYIPTLLVGFETDPSFFLSDQIHPNEAAQKIILATVWDALSVMLTN
ncbi:MAG: arylesterase [Proteobacteria bacterium]|nr:arylesterase [Pseudomonadota bacterium]